ncbi:MAG: tetratricopeptide repeat protein [Rhodospirillaceae bacterium]|nr:tetratricopeptide repeat protein [Rhodospirillaceae bacterium]MBT6859722.1 tetratricopeptide repeat protein [Rhodospirillaceae bacterium]
MAADVAGYTRLMEEDTDGTVAAWQAAREEVIKPRVADHSGNIVKLTGDGFLVEFPTVQDAVNCAIAMQIGLASSSLDFRMGVNLGDIVDDGEDIHGEGVNVAARLEGLAKPNGIIISGSVHEQVKNRIEAQYDDMGAQEVKNVSDPVQAYAVGFEVAADASSPIAVAASKPSIAVLPFDNLSGDPEQEYFSDGMAEDIITSLSRLRHLLVIARNTTFTYKNQPVNIQDVAKELAVRYVLEGSVRTAGNRVRITAQLIDGETGQHLWADRYDRELEDIFDIQDEITEAVTREVSTEVDRAEGSRARAQAPENLDAWTALQKGISFYNDSQAASFHEAEKLFKRTMEFDPRFALGHAWLSLNYARQMAFGFGIFPKEIAFAAAQRAIELDSQEPIAHFAMGWCQFVVEREDVAIEAFEQALRLNPNLSHCTSMLGRALSRTGRYEEAIAQFDLAIKISPRDELIEIAYAGKALTLLMLRDFTGAAEYARRAMHSDRPRFATAFLVCALGHAGKLEEAQIALEEMHRIRPEFTYAYLRETFFALQGDDEGFFMEGLVKGGLEES